MKKFLLSSLLITSILAFSHTDNASAEEKGLNIEIKPSEEHIVLDWNDTGKRYEIHDQDKLIWEGSESEAAISNLESKKLYSFTIISYDENNQKNYVSKVTTQTEAEKNKSLLRSINTENTPSIEDGFIDAVVNSENISLSLRNSIVDEYDGKIEIYKNDKLITTTTEKNFTDTEVSEGETYNYKFVLRKKISDADIVKVKQYLNENNIEITPEVEENVFYEPYEYIKIVTVPKFEISPFWNPPASPGSNQLGFMYRTFIPDKYVPAHSLVSGYVSGHKFGGDNRNFFSFNKGTARTTAEAVVSFTDINSLLTRRSYIAPSTLYDKNNVKIKTSPGQGSISIGKVRNTKDQFDFKINHHAEVGFSDFGTLVPGIDYHVAISVYRNGTFSATGKRDQAPAHEFYVYWPYSEGVFPIIQASNKGFAYLSPVLPRASINVGKQ